MPIQGFTYEDVGGGVNLGGAPSAIDPRQAVLLENWYPYGTKLRRRGGNRRIPSSATPGSATGLGLLSQSNGTWLPILLRPGIVSPWTLAYKLSGGAWVQLDTSTLTTGSDTTGALRAPWTVFQYKDYLYGLRANQGSLVRFDASRGVYAGLAAPAGAPVLAAGSAGALPAGNYVGVRTYYNSTTGYESNPSPASNTLALGANLKINWSSLTASTDSFITHQRLYRTINDQTGVYFFVAQIVNDPLLTTFIGDNVVVSDLGRSVKFTNGLPPAGLVTGAIWNERLFATDERDLFYSEVLLAEAFDPLSVIPVFPDDGGKIRGLFPFGDRLVIGKTNKMHYLVGTDRRSFALFTLSDRHGCMSQASMKAAEGYLFWYGNGKRVYRTDGTSVKEISDPKVASLLEQIKDGDEEFIQAAIEPILGHYIMLIPVGPEVLGNSQYLVYSYRSDTWTVYKVNTRGVPPNLLVDGFDTNKQPTIYSYATSLFKFADRIYDRDDPPDAVSAALPIDCAWETKMDEFGYPGLNKFHRGIWILAPNVASPASLGVASIGDAGGIKLARINLPLADLPDWKGFGIGDPGRPDSRIRARITYSGYPALDIEKIHFEVGLSGRSPRLR